MRYKSFLPWVVGLLAVALVGYWGYQQYSARESMRVYVGNSYQRAFFNVIDHVRNIEAMLAKGLVAADRQQDLELFTDVWRQSNAALDNLAQLPVSDAQISRTAKFLTQVGDYCHSLVLKTAEGQTIDEENWQTLNRLYRQSSILHRELLAINDNVTNGRFDFYKLAGEAGRKLGPTGRNLADANFSTITKQMQDYPSLIYDGPFSDHLERVKPRGLNNEQINQAQARQRAERFIEKRRGTTYTGRVTGEVEGAIPAYRVEVIPERGGERRGPAASMDLSRQGGEVIWMLQPRNIGEARWETDRAREKAQKFLAERGHKNMVARYFQRLDNAVTFNFAAKEGDVILYPDLIKVTVALDNGEVVGYDAKGYLMAHHDRKLPEPKVSREEAAALITPRLRVEEGRLAVIPDGVDKEKLTWEFEGDLDKETFLVYINALTGREENILRLYKTDQGTLAM
ncbi:MAG: germination protein YpeB [Bacillota bacterium]|jgi:germination protein YpeB